MHRLINPTPNTILGLENEITSLTIQIEDAERKLESTKKLELNQQNMNISVSYYKKQIYLFKKLKEEAIKKHLKDSGFTKTYLFFA